MRNNVRYTKTMIRNPFITSGYVSADYFCDRQQESEQLVREVMNGNNLALVSTRRMGKITPSLLIYMTAGHCATWYLHLVKRFWKY